MRIAALIARYLLGLIFLVFGLNGFIGFIPMGPPQAGLAGQFMTVFLQSHWGLIVAAVEVISAVCLLSNQYVLLGITLLGPVVFNIVIFHVLLMPQGLPIALVVAVLWWILAIRYWQYFSPLFARRA